ncbi:MAG: DNA repair exonuclease [bacterium]|nr:DNA repair exonuclease [bacterium]
MKIVFTADNHLGCYYARMTPAQLERRRLALRLAFSQVVDYALENEVDLFLQGGDLFDQPDPRNVEIAFVTGQIKRLESAGIQTVLIGGNHDTPRSSGAPGSMAPHRILSHSNAVIYLAGADGPESVHLSTRHGEIIVGGLSSDPRLQPGDDPLQGASFSDNIPSVLLMHYSLADHGWVAGEPVVKRESLAACGAGIVLLGHNHRSFRQTVGAVTVISAGATERLDFGEIGNRPGFWVLEIENGGLQTDFVTLTPQPMHRLRIAAEDLAGDDPTAIILEHLSEIADEGAMLRLDIEGTLSRAAYHRLRLTEIWRRGTEQSFYFDLGLSGLILAEEEFPTADISVNPQEELRRAAAEMTASRHDDAGRRLVGEALKTALARLHGEGCRPEL